MYKASTKMYNYSCFRHLNFDIIKKVKMNNHKNIPNLKGKVAIVSGANSGTGYGITYHL